MNVGLPGTGLGGIFYLLSAFIVLAAEMFHVVRGRGSRERFFFAFRLSTIALGMVVALLATFWVILQADVLIGLSGGDISRSANILRGHVKPIVITIVILFTLLLGIQLLNIVLRPRRVRE